MTPAQKHARRNAKIYDDPLCRGPVGYSIAEMYNAKSRLTKYFMSLVTSVSFEQRSALTEATVHMLADLPPVELFALDKQYFPEYYV